MNWDAIGSIGEVISAAAVVVSLVYLAYQLRTNTKALRASASWDAEIAFAERNASNSRDPEAALRVARLMDPNGHPDDFSDTERSQVTLDILSMLQIIQAQYFMWRDGSLPDEIWQYRSRWTRRYLLLPIPADYWKGVRSDDLLSEDFVNHIESIKVQEVAKGPLG